MINNRSPPVEQLRVEVGEVLQSDITEKDPDNLPLCVKREQNELLCVLFKTDRENVLRDICHYDPLAWHCIQRDAWHQWFLRTIRIHAELCIRIDTNRLKTIGPTGNPWTNALHCYTAMPSEHQSTRWSGAAICGSLCPIECFSR